MDRSQNTIVIFLSFASEKKKLSILFQAPLLHSRQIHFLQNTELILSLKERDWWPCEKELGPINWQ